MKISPANSFLRRAYKKTLRRGYNFSAAPPNAPRLSQTLTLLCSSGNTCFYCLGLGVRRGGTPYSAIRYPLFRYPTIPPSPAIPLSRYPLFHLFPPFFTFFPPYSAYPTYFPPFLIKTIYGISDSYCFRFACFRGF